MKAAKMLLLLVIIIACCQQSMAQSAVVQAPVNHAKWNYNLKKTVDDDYQLVFHLELDRGWHVRARANNSDTFLRLPSFAFTKNEELQLKGDIQPKGLIEILKIDSTRLVEVYSYKVLYVQSIAAKPGTKISGKYTYQLCNDNACLPVKTEKFAFIMK